MPDHIRLIAIAALACIVAEPAFAYIGPGAGLSLVAAFWALLTAIVASLGFLLAWPIRNWMRRRKKLAAAAGRDADGSLVRGESGVAQQANERAR